MKKFNIAAINDIVETTTTNNTTTQVKISELKPSPYQPRLKEEVRDLALSIKENGLLQPITINQDNIIVAGHRRYYAHIELGLEFIAANTIFADDKKLQTLALIENIQREQLHPIELALSFDDALKNGLFKSAKELAQSISKTESYIAKTRNLLKLPNDIIVDIKLNKTKISIETISLLLKFEEDQLRDIFDRYTKGELNRKDIKDILDEKNKKQTQKNNIKVSSKSINAVFKTDKLTQDEKIDLELELKELVEKYEKKVKT